jgi:hypothetical protein
VLEKPKPCPFCGYKVSLSNPDTLYPNAIGWKVDRGFRHYVSFRDVPKEQWCYSMHCPTTAGGCGAEISGDSIEETLAAWNKRA